MTIYRFTDDLLLLKIIEIQSYKDNIDKVIEIRTSRKPVNLP